MNDSLVVFLLMLGILVFASVGFYRLGASHWWLNKRTYKKRLQKLISSLDFYKKSFNETYNELEASREKNYYYKEYEREKARKWEKYRECEELEKVHAKDLAISHQALEAVRANALVLSNKVVELEAKLSQYESASNKSVEEVK